MTLKQTESYGEINGQRMDFPIVEKPFDADDHNVNIYYGYGRGTRCLFRKVCMYVCMYM